MFGNKLSYSSEHTTRGWNHFLESPVIYNFWQQITGAESWKHRVINEYVKPFRNARILDVGCGTASILQNFDPDLKVDYVGCDINSEYINHAKKKYSNKGNFFCCSADNLPTKENNFDFVLAIAVFHHLSDDTLENLIRLIKNKLKIGGIFILSEPVWTKNQSRLEKYLMKKDRGQNIKSEEEYIKLVKKEFTNIKSIIVLDSHLIPWSVNVIISC